MEGSQTSRAVRLHSPRSPLPARTLLWVSGVIGILGRGYLSLSSTSKVGYSACLAGRSVFDLSESGWPGASKAEGGGEKTKTRKQRGPGGPALRIRPRGGVQGRGAKGLDP